MPGSFRAVDLRVYRRTVGSVLLFRARARKDLDGGDQQWPGRGANSPGPGTALATIRATQDWLGQYARPVPEVAGER